MPRRIETILVMMSFRELAKNYAGLTDEQIARLVQNRQFEEICNDD
jgi:hypothetical protein